MQLILLTRPDFFVEEPELLTSLFEEGLEVLHLRKPHTEPVYSERLLTLIPEQFHRRIVAHDHFYLKKEYGLMGIHLSQRNAQIPDHYRGTLSCTCTTLQEVARRKKPCNYIFLSSVFSDERPDGAQGAFTSSQLARAAEEGVIDHKVMALGGINADNIASLKAFGFGGAVVMHDVWDKFDIHSTQDSKQLLSHFRRLRKLAE